jgi:RNA polymerase sigma-70 factor, ECF subfamily
MEPRQQLEAIYDQHADALFAFLINLHRNEDAAREVLQELFKKLAQQPECLKEARNPRSFLIRMAHRLAIDLVRRRDTRDRYHQDFQDEQPKFFASTNDPDEGAVRTALEIALSELPEEQRAVVHLKLWERFTFEQIAEALDIPLNTAASRHRYGLDKLRKQLRPLYDEIQ